MELARYERSLIDAAGNSLDGTEVTIEVRREISGQPLEPVFSDRAGAVSLGNPFTVTTGEIAFHAVGGAFQVRAFTGPSGAPTLEQIFRYQAVGRSGETDILGLTPKGDWDAVTSFSIGDLVNHGGNAFASNIDANLDNTPPVTAISDANWTSVGAIQGNPGSSNVAGTSITSLTPALGANALTVVEPLRGWLAGARLRVASLADPINDWFEGPIASYADPALSVTADLISPTISAGPFADWTINLAGQYGTDGEDGPVQFHFVTGVPGAGLGVDGDVAVQTDSTPKTHEIFKKITGAWVSQGFLEGDVGATGPVGVVDISFKAASDTDIVLSGEQTVGGVALVAGDDCLPFGQTAAAENGPYLVSAGAWTRLVDYDTWDEIVAALFFGVEEGTFAGNIYSSDAVAGGTLGTTAINFSQRFGAATESDAGLVELNTDAETQTGTDTARAITAANLTAKEASAAEVRAATADRILTTDIMHTAAVEVALTSSTNITAWDMANGINFKIENLGENSALDFPDNPKVGRQGRIRVEQDGTGTRTFTFEMSAGFYAVGAIANDETVDAETIYYYDVISATRIEIAMRDATAQVV